jgi:hypothetical protein
MNIIVSSSLTRKVTTIHNINTRYVGNIIIKITVIPWSYVFRSSQTGVSNQDIISERLYYESYVKVRRLVPESLFWPRN